MDCQNSLQGIPVKKDFGGRLSGRHLVTHFGILIGKHGQTLDAIQSIVEKVINKRRKNRTRVLVDIEGYLETRKEKLEKLAMRLAEKSKRISKPISLGEMNAYDRRIVHIALKDNPDVLTRSRGEGPLRKLVIFPKNRNHSKR